MILYFKIVLSNRQKSNIFLYIKSLEDLDLSDDHYYFICNSINLSNSSYFGNFKEKIIISKKNTKKFEIIT